MIMRFKKALFFILLIVISEISSVGSEPPKKNCVCVPMKTFCPEVPISKFKYYATTAACLVPLGLVAASAPLLAVAGFTSAGIAGGSLGAWLMSLYGGNVAAGSLVAILQSWGAAGVGAGAWASAGGMVATCLGIFFPSLFKKYNSLPDCKTSTDYVCFFKEDYDGSAGFLTEEPSASKASTPFERYPDGKSVSHEELFGSALKDECEILTKPGDSCDGNSKQDLGGASGNG